MVNPKNVHSIIGKHMLADGMEQVIDLNKSHGSWLIDARDGKEYLDLFSMFASLPVGYNHPYLLENQERLIAPTLNKITNSDIYSTEMAQFVDTVGAVAQPNYLPYSFFVEGGALGVENALKTAFDWKVRKNMTAGKGEKGSKVIHFRDCFHGRTGYTMSLTDSPDPRKTLYFPQFDWPRIDNPKLHFPVTDEVLDNVIKSEKIAIDQITSALQNNPDEIACLIIEPIQGEGGDNHFRDDFMIKIREICDNNDIIFIFDEVQTGIGITGKMWAHEHFSVKPDIISFGKKTQVCGMMASDRIYNFENNVFKESSRINSTFGGNLVDMYRFKLILEIMCNENLFSNVQEMGYYLLKHIHELTNEFPGYVTNPRGQGLFCAFDMPSGIERDKMISKLLDEKVIILGSGDNSIRFRPHLNVKKKDIDIAFEKINMVCKTMLN